MKRREIAKFFSGFAASQALFHGALAAAGLEFTLLGIAYTRGLNTFAFAVSAAVAVALWYVGWARK